MCATLILVAFIGGFILQSSAEMAESESKDPNKPHIIILMADDMGFNDVSFRKTSQVYTPNIDALGYQGLILNRHYVPHMCTPSRAALLTGINPVHTGMQHYVIRSCEPYGLPLDLILLPQYLKKAGYKTHLVGKWHLGNAKKAFIPTERGFDSFFGFYTGAIEYYNHTDGASGSAVTETGALSVRGYDFRRNEEVTYEGFGQYATYLFTNESLKIIGDHNPKKPLFLVATYNAPHAADGPVLLEAPQDEIDKINYISDPNLRTFAAMMNIMDRGIGQIIKKLSHKDMLKNSVILFYSDNGSPIEGLYANEGSNYPLRGQKSSPWEGGIRVPAIIWSPAMKYRHGVSSKLIHNTDWLPTFLALAGIRPKSNVDGFNMWPTLTKNLPSPRDEMIHNIDPIDQFVSVYYRGWKYINGTTDGGQYDGWLSPSSNCKDQFGVKYTESVMKSDTWKALSPFARKTITSKTIRRIRKMTEVYCPAKIPYSGVCEPLKAPCLFKITDDPCEMNNLAQVYPFRTYLMQILVKKWSANVVYPINQPSDFAGCDPRKHNGTFTWWLD
ncbi:arylsulfatase B-like [Phlebotomus argentipes]|uniref:arylsulfatase B-like n=1 Tax=Phlebotomus argentipes TaxID=94469 RepID=UPI002892BA56|nr:arylsulfatase B-like [Phlebotomus argentipes]